MEEKKYLVKVLDREDDTKEYQVTRVFDGKDERKAQKYFNQLKSNLQSHQPDDYYDEEEDILYRNVRIALYENDKRIKYVTIG